MGLERKSDTDTKRILVPVCGNVEKYTEWDEEVERDYCTFENHRECPYFQKLLNAPICLFRESQGEIE